MIYVRREGEPSNLKKKKASAPVTETKKKVGRPKKGVKTNG